MKLFKEAPQCINIIDFANKQHNCKIICKSTEVWSEVYLIGYAENESENSELEAIYDKQCPYIQYKGVFEYYILKL